MTLLAYDLPKTGAFATCRIGPISITSMSRKLSALVLSFIIAGLFWFSHHRRLARQPEAGRGIAILNLVFLLSIILLPVTNGLYGNYRLSSAVAVLYGTPPHRDRRPQRAVVVARRQAAAGTKSPARSFRCWCSCPAL